LSLAALRILLYARESVPIAVVAESSAEKKDALEAVIDILVYVKKTDL
jgi:hypothetical protein